jgi:hypothetical protein
VFENNGEVTWPEEIYFRQIRGEGDGYEQRLDGVALEAGAQITISVDVNVPGKPGHHALLFRLAYGEDKVGFGDEVFLNLVSTAEDEVHDTPVEEPAAASGYFFGLAGMFTRLTETNWYSTPGVEEADAADENRSSASSPDDLDISQSSWQVVREDDVNDDEAEEMATTPAPVGPAGEEEETEKTDTVLVAEEEGDVTDNVYDADENEEEEVESLVANDEQDERIDNPYIDDIEEETTQEHATEVDQD